MKTSSSVGLLAVLLIAGCARSGETQSAPAANGVEPSGSAAPTPEAPAAKSLPTDAWIGRWIGPEGLFLDIRPAKTDEAGRYAIVNKDNLDRQANYSGIADGMTIRFVRDGKDLSIRPGTGAYTGFKDLADKKDCLIVITGQEGYCR
jgi:hypothetical protein